MAFLVKNQQGAYPQNGVIDQWLRASVPDATNPATTSRKIFTISGGRVLVRLLAANVGTVQQTQANNTSVTYTPTGGSNADLASNLDTTGDGAGTYWLVEGDGTALVATTTTKFTTLAHLGTSPYFIIDSGEIFWKTSATSTGSAKWDLFYVPLDPGASVQGNG